jgi:hypothetical protein
LQTLLFADCLSLNSLGQAIQDFHLWKFNYCRFLFFSCERNVD